MTPFHKGLLMKAAQHMAEEFPINRRVADRKDCSLELRFHNGREWVRGIATNISTSGARIVTIRPMASGTRVKVLFDNPRGIEKRVVGEVVWHADSIPVEGSKWIAPGMGIRFDAPVHLHSDDLSNSGQEKFFYV